MKVIAILLMLVGSAQAQCYSRSYAGQSFSYCAPVGYSTPTFAYSAPLVQTYCYPPFAVSYNIALPNYAATGSTAYGYGYPQATGLDPATLLNSAGRYLQLSTDAAQQGFSQYNQSANVINAGNSRAMEAQIRQQLAQQILQGGSLPNNAQPAAAPAAAAQAGAPMTTPAAPAGDPPSGAAAAPTSLQAVAESKCTKCHGGSRKEKNLDLRDLSALDATKVREVLKRIMSDDPGERMPPVKETPLTVEEKIAFIAGAIGPTAEKAANGKSPPETPKDPSVPNRPPMAETPKLQVPKG